MQGIMPMAMTTYELTLRKRYLRLVRFADRTSRTWPYRSSRALQQAYGIHERLEGLMRDRMGVKHAM